MSGHCCQVMTCMCPMPAGSGSGSSGGVGSGVSTLQHLAKQPSLTSNISPKTTTGSSYYFSSLPRGILGGYNSLSRPATLPRQPLQQLLLDGYSNSSSGDSKRNSDSVLFQRLFHPLPACDPVVHSGSGFHDVFDAARDPACKLRSLNVSKCLLGAEDALCLGLYVSVCISINTVGSHFMMMLHSQIFGCNTCYTIQLMYYSHFKTQSL